jgi:hypothetical protein
LAGEELLHGGLFEVALLGDEPVQPAQQRVTSLKCRRDGALFGNAAPEAGYALKISESLAVRRVMALNGDICDLPAR